MQRDEIEDLEAQLDALEGTLGATQGMVAAFEGELTRLGGSVTETGRSLNGLSRGLSGDLKRAFEGAVFDGKSLSDTLKNLGESLLQRTYSSTVRPVTNQLGGALASGIESLVSGVLPFADGAGFVGGRVMPFAKGGVVSGPTTFPMRGGVGLMGEAGPEAIMPLARGPDGRLGVETQGGAKPVSVTVNVSTPDVEGFRRSQSQIAALVGRSLDRGRRNL